MPRLMQVMISADFDEGVFEIIRDTINECGCVSLFAESERHGLPMERIRSSLESLSGVTCNDESCCVTNLQAFSEAMKKLAGGE